MDQTNDEDDAEADGDDDGEDAEGQRKSFIKFLKTWVWIKTSSVWVFRIITSLLYLRL